VQEQYETTDSLKETLSFSKTMSQESFLLPQKNVTLFRYNDKLYKKIWHAKENVQGNNIAFQEPV